MSVNEPYKLPEGWKWVNTKDIAEVVTGSTPPTKNKLYFGEYIPFVKPNDLSQGRHLKYSNEYLSHEGCKISRKIPKKSVLLCCIGSIGKNAFSEVDCCTNQQINALIPKENIILPEILYFGINTPYYKDELLKNSSATTISIINKSKTERVLFPLIDYENQDKLSRTLDSLLSKLTKVKDLIADAKDTFEKRRMAILNKAFTGELTRKWREENNSYLNKSLIAEDVQIYEHPYQIPTGWKWLKLSDACSKITDGTHNSPKNYSEGKYKYITAKNIKENRIELENITFINEETHKEIYKRCNVEYGDVLYIKDGATTGIAAVNTLNEEFSLLSSVALLKPNKEIINSKYLAYILNSSETKNRMLNEMAGIAITRLTLEKIKKAVIVVPPIVEQSEIVRILDFFINKEDEAKVLTDLEEQISLMEKSILSKAFRGEL